MKRKTEKKEDKVEETKFSPSIRLEKVESYVDGQIVSTNYNVTKLNPYTGNYIYEMGLTSESLDVLKNDPYVIGETKMLVELGMFFGEKLYVQDQSTEPSKLYGHDVVVTNKDSQKHWRERFNTWLENEREVAVLAYITKEDQSVRKLLTAIYFMVGLALALVVMVFIHSLIS